MGRTLRSSKRKGRRRRSKGPRGWGKLQKIMNKEQEVRERVSSGIEDLDEWFGGGLPYGVTVFYGKAGTGKSQMARRIAMSVDNAVFICSEKLIDAPDHELYPDVDVFDYVNYTPSYKVIVREICTIVENLNPTVVVCDSGTKLFSVTNKALAESDIREAISELHKKLHDIPVIVTSEVRGTGFSESTAGGEAVKHKCNMLVRFDHVVANFSTQSQSYGIEMGEDIYVMSVEKDAEGASKTDRAKVMLRGDEDINLRKVIPYEG